MYKTLYRVKYCKFSSNNTQKGGNFDTLDKNARFQTFFGSSQYFKVLESVKKLHIGPGTTELSHIEFGHF